MTIADLRTLARRYEELAAMPDDSRDHCQKMGAASTNIGAALKAAGSDRTTCLLVLGFLAGARPGDCPRAAIALSYLASPLTLRVSEVERLYVRMAALAGEPHDRSRLPSWLTSAPFQPPYPGPAAETRALGGIAAGFSAYAGQIMTGARHDYAVLADMLLAAHSVMAPGQAGDGSHALFVIGHTVGVRYDYVPERAAALLALFLDPAADARTIRPLHRILCALTCREPDDSDLAHWVS